MGAAISSAGLDPLRLSVKGDTAGLHLKRYSVIEPKHVHLYDSVEERVTCMNGERVKDCRDLAQAELLLLRSTGFE